MHKNITKKLSAYILALTILTLIAASNLFAQMPQTRVKFARGRNSTTLSGTIAKNGIKSFALGAKAGQTLTATLSSTNGKVDFMQGQLHDTQYNQTVDQTGDVFIDIDNHGSASKYTLTISIQ